MCCGVTQCPNILVGVLMTVMEPMIDDPDLLNSCLLLMLLFRLITRGGDRKRRKAIMPTTYRWENNRVPIKFQTGVFCEFHYGFGRVNSVVYQLKY